MKNLFETIKERPVLSGAIAAGTLVMGVALGVEIQGFNRNPTSPAPVGSCESPMAETKIYPGIDTNSLVLHTGIGEGVVVSGRLSQDAYGVQAAFKYGGPGEHQWTKSEVVPIDPGTGAFAVKLAVGEEPVIFGVQAVAPGDQQAGRDICAEVPIIQEQYFTNLPDSEANVPWPHIGNVPFS